MFGKEAHRRALAKKRDRIDGAARSAARVAAVRREIANGTYLTAEKLDIVAEKLAALLLRPTRRRRVSA